MTLTSTVFISDYSPSSNYSVFGYRVFWFRWVGFGWVLSKLFGIMMSYFWWQGLTSEILCISSLGSIWVVCMLVRECVQGFVFYVPIVYVFLSHFVQLVPFGQLGENFWGVGHAVKYQNSKFYCKYLSKFYWL